MITFDGVKDTPSWDVFGTIAPRLPVQTAVKSAHNELKRFVSDIKDWQVKEVTLEPFNNEKWFYVILFELISSEKTKFMRGSFRIVVRMDGSIVALVSKNKETEKQIPGIPIN